MTDKINTELARLQDELNSLDIAVNHIAKAEKISQEVVESAKNINQKFGEQLEKVLDTYDKAIEETKQQTNEKLQTIVSAHKNSIDELNTQNQSVIETHKNSVNELNSKTQEIVDDHKKSIAEIEQKVETVLNEYQKITEKTNDIIQNYDSLAGETKAMTQKIEDVNFDEQFSQVREKILQINENVEKNDQRINALDERIKKNVSAETTKINLKIDAQEETIKAIQNNIDNGFATASEKNTAFEEVLTQLLEQKTKVLIAHVERQGKKIRNLRRWVVFLFIMTLLLSFATFVSYLYFNGYIDIELIDQAGR